MPRNSAGGYSLPSGNPVTGGTAIQSSWANTTLADIANEVTNSLDRSGRGAMASPLKLSDGSAAAPGMTFASDPNNGFYRNTTDDWSASAGGVEVVKFTVAGVEFPASSVNIGGVQFNPDEWAKLTGGVFTGNVTFTEDVTVNGALIGGTPAAWSAQVDLSVAANATQTAFDFGTGHVQANLGSVMSTSTGAVTVPVAGVYSVCLHAVGVNGIGGINFQVRIRINGAEVYGVSDPLYAISTNALVVQTVTLPATLALSANDVLTPYIFHSGSSGTLTGSLVWSGHLVSQV
jgi:hypothetical protein